MANKITLEFEVTDKGTLKQVTQGTEKLSRAIKDSSNATEKASTKKNHYNKMEKGTARLTSNTTKSFSKQAQTIGSGLVPAYATLAANIFAVSAAFGALKRAAGLEQLEAGLIAVGSAAGQNLPYIADQLREITGAAISTQSAMESVALGTSAGFSTTQMEELTRVAKGASLALGRDMEDAMSRLVRGAAKLEPEILDELGIMVRLDDVTTRYAETVGKTVDSLTQFERRMAFTNAIIDQGTSKFGQIAEQIDPNPYNKLAATFADLTKNVLGFVNSGLGPFASLLADNMWALVGTVAIFGTSVASKMLPAMFEAADAATESAESFRDLSKEQLKGIKITDEFPAKFKTFSESLKNGTHSLEEQKEALKSLNMSINTMDKKTNPKKFEAVTEARKQYTEAIVSSELATVKDSQAAALGAINQGKFREAISLNKFAMEGYSSAMRRNMKVQGNFGKVLSATKIGVFKLTSSFKLVGTAVLRFLPYIGLAITAFSALKATWDKLFGKSELEKQVDEIAESFDSFAEINDTLENTIDNIVIMGSSMSESKQDAELYTASLEAQAGVYGQISDAIQKVLDLEKKKDIEVIKTMREDLRELESDLTSEQVAKLKAGGQAAQEVMDANNKMFGRNKATEYFFALQNVEEKMNDLGEASKATAATIANNLLENAIINIESNKTVSEAMQKELDLYKQYQEVLRQYAGDPEIVEEVKKAIDDMANSTKQAVAEIKGLSETTRKFNIEFTKLLKPKDTPFQEIIGSLDQMSNVLNNAEGNSERLRTVWENLPESILNILGETPDTQGLQDYIKSWESASAAIADAESNAKAFKSAAERIKDTHDLDTDAEALRDYYTELDKSVDAANKGLNEQKTLLKTSLEHTDNKANLLEKIAAIDDEIAANNRERVSEEEKSLAYKLAGLEAEEEIKGVTSDLLDIRKDLSDIAKEDLDLQEKAIERELQRAEMARKRATFGTASDSPERRSYEATEPVNQAQAELEAFEQLASRKLEVARQELNLNLEQIELDFELQHLKLEVIRAEAEAAGKTNLVGKINEVMAKLPALQTATQEAAMAGYDNLAAQMKQEKLELQFNVSDAVDSMITDVTSAFESVDIGENLASMFSGLSEIESPISDILASLSTFPEIHTESKKTFEDLASVRSKFNETYADQLATIADKQTKGIELTQEETTVQKQGAKLTESETRSKMAMYAQYGQAVGSTLGAIAEQQDTSTKEGFERNKKMQMGMAVVNTASSIMNAMATMPYPMNLAAAAVSAAMGAAQISAISSTSFGDSSAPSAGGSMSAGFSVGGESVQSTVLGSSDFSESLGNSNELLKEIHAKEYFQLRAIADGIENINLGIEELNTSIIRDFPAWGESDRGDTLSEYFFGTGRNVGEDWSGWYTNKAWLTAQEIGLKDALNLDSMDLGLDTKSRPTKGNWTDLSFDLVEDAAPGSREYLENIENNFAAIYKGVAETIVDFGDVLGDAIEGFDSKISEITLEGLGIQLITGGEHNSEWQDPEELETILMQAFSTMSDRAFAEIFGDAFGQYQELGEGLQETVTRVAATRTIVSDFLDSMGTDIEDAVEEVDISVSMSNALGGLKEFQEASESFTDIFMSEEQKFAKTSEHLTKIFAQMNEDNQELSFSLPKTREELLSLASSLDVTSEAQRETFTSILDSIDQLDEYYSYVEEKEEERLDKITEFYSLEAELLDAQGYSYKSLTLQRAQELNELDAVERGIKKQIWALEDFNSLQDQHLEILGMLGREEEVVAFEREQALKGLSETGKVLQSAIYDMTDYIERTEELAKAEDALANARNNAMKSVSDLIDNLMGSNKAPVQSMEYFEDKYNRLQSDLTTAKTPKELEDATSAFTGFSENYLDFMAAYGGNYKDAFTSVMSSLDNAQDTIGNFSTTIDDSTYFAIKDAFENILGASPSMDKIFEFMGMDGDATSNILNSLTGGDVRRAGANSYLDSQYGGISTTDYPEEFSSIFGGSIDTTFSQLLDPMSSMLLRVFREGLGTIAPTPEDFDYWLDRLNTTFSSIPNSAEMQNWLSSDEFSALTSTQKQDIVDIVQDINQGDWRYEAPSPLKPLYTSTNLDEDSVNNLKVAYKESIEEAFNNLPATDNNMEVKVYLGTREMKDYHVEWHKTDSELKEVL